jgi:predicted kinase
MKEFKSFISEAKSKPAVFTFGRFNPPTNGHEKLVDQMVKVSKQVGGEPILFSSHSSDKVKNPLTHKDKVKFLKSFFGRKVNVVNEDVKQIFQILVFLYDQGYRNIVMIVGSDRIAEFKNIITKYNSVKGRHGFYKFDDISVVSAGERDPDADDVSGMSASKMRMFAEKGDLESFTEGVPSSGKRLAKKLYNAVRKGMGIKEVTQFPKYMIDDMLNEGLLTEGVYDQGIFKAVFLMGGPGSGKSTVVDKLALPSLGLKLVNTDRAFENGLKKAGMSLDLRKASDDDYAPIRAKAKKITGKQMGAYINARLGMIFDTTAAKKSKIQDYKDLLDQAGYEYKMVYVKTSLKNALKRNQMRPRKLRDDIVINDWNNAEKNAKQFKQMFGRDFIEVVNDDDLASLDTKVNKLFGKVMTWASKFPTNDKAQDWKQSELTKKKR